MLAKLHSCAIVGLDGEIVRVEVDIAQGLPAFTIVGLPDAAVQEARERVRAAIRNSGFDFPQRRITVNLAPADLPKGGPAYDLPIAVGLLMASGQLAPGSDESIFLGELSLDGLVRHLQGILPMAALAKERGFGTVYVPEADAGEAALIEGLQIVPVASLTQLVAHLQGVAAIALYAGAPPSGDSLTHGPLSVRPVSVCHHTPSSVLTVLPLSVNTPRGLHTPLRFSVKLLAISTRRSPSQWPRNQKSLAPPWPQTRSPSCCSAIFSDQFLGCQVPVRFSGAASNAQIVVASTTTRTAVTSRTG